MILMEFRAFKLAVNKRPEDAGFKGTTRSPRATAGAQPSVLRRKSSSADYEAEQQAGKEAKAPLLQRRRSSLSWSRSRVLPRTSAKPTSGSR